MRTRGWLVGAKPANRRRSVPRSARDRCRTFLSPECRRRLQRAHLLHDGTVDVESRRFLVASDLLALDARIAVTTCEAAFGYTDA